MPGGTTLDLNRCDSFTRELHPAAGPVHVAAEAMTTGNVSLDLTISSEGHSSHTTVANDGNVDTSRAP
ncbi:MAG: hypothetical protein ABR532_02395 [Candidatus Dormibacteria bacterium]